MIKKYTIKMREARLDERHQSMSSTAGEPVLDRLFPTSMENALGKRKKLGGMVKGRI